jgi:hypothetical protein
MPRGLDTYNNKIQSKVDLRVDLTIRLKVSDWCMDYATILLTQNAADQHITRIIRDDRLKYDEGIYDLDFK